MRGLPRQGAAKRRDGHVDLEWGIAARRTLVGVNQGAPDKRAMMDHAPKGGNSGMDIERERRAASVVARIARGGQSKKRGAKNHYSDTSCRLIDSIRPAPIRLTRNSPRDAREPCLKRLNDARIGPRGRRRVSPSVSSAWR